MKKIISLVCLITLLVTALCACRNGSESTTDSQSSTSGQPLTVMLTFPEGYSVVDIAQKLEENGVCSAKDFLAAANDVLLAQEYGFTFTKQQQEHRAFLLEGYLFPDTYEFYLDETAQTAIGRFLENTATKLSALTGELQNPSDYTTDELLTVASIIQREIHEPQMAAVSSVILNRLNDGMKLQCDSTIDYLESTVKPHITGDKDRYNEYYNTYKCDALPKGPICCPGQAAIEAALMPEQTDYLYFVTDRSNPDIAYFAETYDEHLDNCTLAGW